MDLQHEHRLSPWKAESGPIHSGVFELQTKPLHSGRYKHD